VLKNKLFFPLYLAPLILTSQAVTEDALQLLSLLFFFQALNFL